MLGVSTDCLGFGLGLRGGKTWDNHLYIGGSFVYHFAGCGYSNFGTVAGNYSTSASAFYFGPEGGYDFDLKAVVLRAYMGLGMAFFNASVSGPGVNESASSNQFVVWPGASVILGHPQPAVVHRRRRPLRERPRGARGGLLLLGRHPPRLVRRQR